MEAAAREIAGPDATAEIQELARQIAEAQIDVRRVRYARHHFLSDCLIDQSYGLLFQETKELLAMDRYERRALSRRKFAIRAFEAAQRQAVSVRK